MTRIGFDDGGNTVTARTAEIATSGGMGPFTIDWVLSASHMLSVGGVPQPRSAYTATADFITNTSEITLSSAPGSSDYIDVYDLGIESSSVRTWEIDEFTGDGTTNEFTLTQDPGASRNCFVTLSGVLQHKTEYTVAGTNLTFTTAPVSGMPIQVRYSTAIVAATVPNGSVTNAKLDDSVITGQTAETDVDTANDHLLIYDSSAGTLRKVTPKNLGGGAWEFVSETQISNNATVDVTTGFSTDYDQIKFTFHDVLPSSDGPNICFYFRQASTWRTDAYYDQRPNGWTATETQAVLAQTATNGTGGGVNGSVFLVNPHSTTSYPASTGGRTICRTNTSNVSSTSLSVLYTGATGAVDGIRFFASSGNLASGTIRMYGLKKS